jgi:hypothetical protein
MCKNAGFVVLCCVASFASACSVSNAYVYPREVQERYLITAGDTSKPHLSRGYIQISRSGANLFGFASLVDADLQTLFGELVVPELEKAGADGIINMQFEERQYTLGTKILFAIPPFCFIPLPTHVQLTGELVSFKNAVAAPSPLGSGK